MNQEKQLEVFLKQNPSVQKILERADELGLSNWHLAAGCIAQTVWNIKHGFDPEHGIKDYDLVYYDASDISCETQDEFNRKGKELFKDVSGLVEIVNEARVHLWYEEEFGRLIEQYRSVEDAIDTFPTTATSIGVRMINGTFDVYPPLGLDDLLGMIARANKVKITQDIYEAKIKRWQSIWPQLTVIPWDVQ